MGAEDQSNVLGVFMFLLNGLSSITIIMVNKQLMSKGGYGFNFATSLCGVHFLCTWLTSILVKWSSAPPADAKAVTKAPFTDILLFCVCADVSIVGMNMSLMMNTVGFYQISKLSTIPVICVIDYVWFHKRFHEKVILSIVVVLLGVAIATVSDVGLNGAGLVVAVVAVLATAGQQVLIGSLQKAHSITANDLMGQTAPIQAASLLVMGPLVDYLVVGEYVWAYQWHVPSLVAIAASCVLAAAVNTSQYFCIGRFSAISFQVLGHSKTVGVLALGFMLFGAPVTLRNLCGMGLAVLGMVGYGVFSVSNPATVDPPPQLPTVASPLDAQPKRPQGSLTN